MESCFSAYPAVLCLTICHQVSGSPLEKPRGVILSACEESRKRVQTPDLIGEREEQRKDNLQMALVLKAKPTAIPLQGREFILCGK